MECLALTVTFDNQGKQDTLHPVILANESEKILVDCGYPGFTDLLSAAAAVHGISMGELTGILITHDDFDHVGSLSELKLQYPSLRVYATASEAASIAGRKKSARLLQAEAIFDGLPEEIKPGALHFQNLLRSLTPVEADFTFTDGDDLNWLDDVQIIHTPGHTPGHISLYLEKSRTLIAGDAIVIEGDDFEIANPHFTIDLAAAVDSVIKLRRLEIDRIVCYHGGEKTSGISEGLDRLVERYSS